MKKPTALVYPPGYLPSSWNDPDETEGRRLYRARADAIAAKDDALANFEKNMKRVSLRKEPR